MGMTGDHELLVRRDDPGGDSAVDSADARSSGRVGRLVEIEAEPGGAAADPGANLGRVFADPSGEHKRVIPGPGSRRPAPPR